EGAAATRVEARGEFRGAGPPHGRSRPGSGGQTNRAAVTLAPLSPRGRGVGGEGEENKAECKMQKSKCPEGPRALILPLAFCILTYSIPPPSPPAPLPGGERGDKCRSGSEVCASS